MKKKKLQRLLGLATESNEQKDLELEKLHSEILSLKAAPHIKEAVSEMDELEKDVVDPSTNFSISEFDCTKYYGEKPVLVMFCGQKRFATQINNTPSPFMPDVKFIVPDELPSYEFPFLRPKPFNFCATYENGNAVAFGSESWYRELEFDTVSIYEAIPELVPDGMVYDKESDSLEHISPFAKLAKEFKDWTVWDSLNLGKKIDDKKVVAEPSINFSSRFMPNVKFKNFLPIEKTLRVRGLSKKEYFFTNSMGGMGSYTNQLQYLKDNEVKEVSIYEAVPELVPNGFYFSKAFGTLLCLNETFYKEEDSEAFEVALSKAAHFKKDDAFKVTEVVSACDTCAIKASCSLLCVLEGSDVISECAEHYAIPTAEDVKLGKLLTELQLHLWGTGLPVLIGVEFNSEVDKKDTCLTNYTIHFTTADNTKKS